MSETKFAYQLEDGRWFAPLDTLCKGEAYLLGYFEEFVKENPNRRAQVRVGKRILRDSRDSVMEEPCQS